MKERSVDRIVVKTKKKLNFLMVFMMLFVIMIPNLASIEKVSANSYKEITVYGYAQPKPGVEWGQVDNGDFRALAGGVYYYTPNVGTKANPVPKAAAVPDRIDMRNYAMPREYEDPLTKKKYSPSQVVDKQLDGRNGGVSFGPGNGLLYKGLNIRVDGTNHVAIYTETGQGYQEMDRFKYPGITKPDGSPKWAVQYHTPLQVTWVGKVRIYGSGLSLKANATNACIGDTIRVTPTLTKEDGSQHNVASHPNFSYSFPVGSGIVSSTRSGDSIIVRGNGEGSVGFIGRFVDSSQNINVTDDITLRFVDCDDTPIPDPDPEEEPEKKKYTVHIDHIDSDTSRLLQREQRTVEEGDYFSAYPKPRGTYRDSGGNPYVASPLGQSFSGTINSNQTIRFYYRVSLPDPTEDVEIPSSTEGQASGKAFWELRRINTNESSHVYTENKFSIAGNHFATRNIKHWVNFAGSTVEQEAPITRTAPGQTVKNTNYNYSFGYEYTNFYRDNYSCVDSQGGDCFKWVFVDRTPLWDLGETFSLAGSILIDHSQNETVKRDTMDELLGERWIVGKEDAWNPNKSSKTYYEQWKKDSSNDLKSFYELKTQTSLPIRPGKWIYDVELPSNSHKASNFSPLRKEGSFGWYFPVDLDDSLKLDYKK